MLPSLWMRSGETPISAHRLQLAQVVRLGISLGLGQECFRTFHQGHSAFHTAYGWHFEDVVILIEGKNQRSPQEAAQDRQRTSDIRKSVLLGFSQPIPCKMNMNAPDRPNAGKELGTDDDMSAITFRGNKNRCRFA
jgi:hypothetical protein